MECRWYHQKLRFQPRIVSLWVYITALESSICVIVEVLKMVVLKCSELLLKKIHTSNVKSLSCCTVASEIQNTGNKFPWMIQCSVNFSYRSISLLAQLQDQLNLFPSWQLGQTANLSQLEKEFRTPILLIQALSRWVFSKCCDIPRLPGWKNSKLSGIHVQHLPSNKAGLIKLILFSESRFVWCENRDSSWYCHRKTACEC